MYQPHRTFSHNRKFQVVFVDLAGNQQVKTVSAKSATQAVAIIRQARGERITLISIKTVKFH